MSNPNDLAMDWPAYWLVALESAVTTGDYAAAAVAQDHLRRLGREVTMRLLQRPSALPVVAPLMDGKERRRER
jgi:hypothetical protein